MKYDPMQKHEKFILDTLLPTIVNHGMSVGASPDEAALACFLYLGTVLQSRGFSADELLAAITGSALTAHEAPGGLQ